MTDIRSQILSEVEENLSSGYVQMMHDAMEKCPTLAKMIELCELAGVDNSIAQSVGISKLIGDNKPVSGSSWEKVIGHKE